MNKYIKHSVLDILEQKYSRVKTSEHRDQFASSDLNEENVLYRHHVSPSCLSLAQNLWTLLRNEGHVIGEKERKKEGGLGCCGGGSFLEGTRSFCHRSFVLTMQCDLRVQIPRNPRGASDDFQSSTCHL